MGWGIVSSREWLESIPAEMPVRPPFRLDTALEVVVGGNIYSGPDHRIVGVAIRSVGNAHDTVPTMPPAQARALAQALLDGADEAERKTWFRNLGQEHS